MANLRISLNLDPVKRLSARLGVGARVAAEPMLGQRGQRFVALARNGDGGIRQQFAEERGQTARGSEPWSKESPSGGRAGAFGNRQAPRKLLQRSGAYRGAWLGGPGAITKVTHRTFEIGVDSTMFPQVVPFQSAQGRRVTITDRMRGYVRYAFGVNYRKSTKSFLIPRRAVGLGSKVKRTIAAALKDEVMKAVRQQARRAGI